MSESKTNGLKKIAYNCRKATFLIEKRQIATITLREKLELTIHLAGCAVCVKFMKQSMAIHKMVHHLFHAAADPGLKLDETFKKQLQDRIEDQLDKN